MPDKKKKKNLEMSGIHDTTIAPLQSFHIPFDNSPTSCKLTAPLALNHTSSSAANQNLHQLCNFFKNSKMTRSILLVDTIINDKDPITFILFSSITISCFATNIIIRSFWSLFFKDFIKFPNITQK